MFRARKLGWVPRGFKLFKVLSSQSRWTNGVLAHAGFHRFCFMALYSNLVTEYVGGALTWAEFMEIVSWAL